MHKVEKTPKHLPPVGIKNTHTTLVDLVLIDGNAAVPVIGLLQTDAINGSRIWIKTLNNQHQARWNMSTVFQWQQLHGVQDLDGAGTSGMIAAGTRTSNGQVRIDFRTSTGAVGLQSVFKP